MITKFIDRADNYLAWKSSFKNVSQELEVNSVEEMDLLVKYLGTESQKFALSLRMAYLSDPGKGLVQLWSRLDEKKV